MTSFRTWASGVVIVAALGCGRARSVDDGTPTATPVDVAPGQDALEVAHAVDASRDAAVEDEEVRRALHKFGGEEGVGVGGAEEWLVAHPDRARPALVAILTSGQRGIHIKHVLRTLGRIGHADDVPLLRERFLGGEGTEMWAAAQALEVHPAESAFDALVEGLGSPDVDVISTAVFALGRRGDERARALIEALIDHADRAVRSSVIYSLQKLGVEPSRKLLEARRKVERDAHVKKVLAEVLGKAGGTK